MADNDEFGGLRDPYMPPNVNIKTQRRKSWWERDSLPPNVNVRRQDLSVESELSTSPATAETNGSTPPPPYSGETIVEPQDVETELISIGEEEVPPPKEDKGPLGFGILPGVRGRFAGLRGGKKSHLGGNKWKSVD